MSAIPTEIEILALIESYKIGHPKEKVPLGALIKEKYPDAPSQLIGLDFRVYPPSIPFTLSSQSLLPAIPFTLGEVEQYGKLGGDMEAALFKIDTEITWGEIESSQLFIELMEADGATEAVVREQVKAARALFAVEVAERAKQVNPVVTVSGALLKDVDFSGLAIDDCQFDGCDLQGAVFGAQSIKNTSFKDAILQQSIFHATDFSSCDFDNCDMDYSELQAVKFQDSSMRFAHMNYLRSSSLDIQIKLSSGEIAQGVSLLGDAASSVTFVSSSAEVIKLEDLTLSHSVNLERVLYRHLNDSPKVLMPIDEKDRDFSSVVTKQKIEQLSAASGGALNVVTLDANMADVVEADLARELNLLNASASKYMQEIEANCQRAVAERSDLSFFSLDERELLDELGWIADSPEIDPISSWSLVDIEACPLFAKLLPQKGVDGARADVIAARNQFKLERLNNIDDRKLQAVDQLMVEQQESLSMQMIKHMRDHAQDFPQMSLIFERAKAAYDACDSVMLTGVGDIDPRFFEMDFDSDALDGDTGTNLEKDALEFMLLYIQRYSAEPKPLHAIGRGAQIVGASYGAKPVTFRSASVSPREHLHVRPLAGEHAERASTLSLGSTLLEASLIKNTLEHHQGFYMDGRVFGLQPVDVVTEPSATAQFSLMAEDLPQNIAIVQGHPELAGLTETSTGICNKISDRFLGNLISMTRGVADKNRAKMHDLRAFITRDGVVFDKTPGRDKLKPLTNEDLERLTRPTLAKPEAKTDYDTVVVGLGPVGLTNAISAIERGEKVALLTDRSIDGGLGVRQQVLGVDEVMDWVMELVDDSLREKYLAANRLKRIMYQPTGKDGKPLVDAKTGEIVPEVPYWGFSTGALEDILVEELKRRIELKNIQLAIDVLEARGDFFDEAFIETFIASQDAFAQPEWLSLSAPEKRKVALHAFYVDKQDDPEYETTIAEAKAVTRSDVGVDILDVEKIPPDLTADIDLAKRFRISDDPDSLISPSKQKELARVKKLREHISVEKKELIVGSVKKINGVAVTGEDERLRLGFRELLASNGAKQQAEKSMIGTFHGDNVHMSHPLHESHVAVIFQLKNERSIAFDDADEEPFSSEVLDKMLAYCKINKHVPQKVSMATLHLYGWSGHSRPHQQVYTTGADRVGEPDYCYIGCEIPEALKVDALLKTAQVLAKLDSPEAREAYLADLPIKIAAEFRELLSQDDGVAIFAAFSEDPRAVAQVSKKLIREWSRLLIKDALPKEVCSEAFLADPAYSSRDRGKQILSTSQFDLGFFELGQSIAVLDDPESGLGAITSMGDGRMFPLYTTGTGAQTGLKLAQAFHQAKERYLEDDYILRTKGRLETRTRTIQVEDTSFVAGIISSISGSPQFRDEAIEENVYVPFDILFDAEGEMREQGSVPEEQRAAYQAQLDEYTAIHKKRQADMYIDYHAHARAVVDVVREIQSDWINARNARFVKAEKVFQTLVDAKSLEVKVDNVLASCNETERVCRVGSAIGALEARPTMYKRIYDSLKHNNKPPVLDDKTMRDIARSMDAISTKLKESKAVISELYTQFYDGSDVVSYEELPRHAFQSEHEVTAEQYYQRLSETCGEIHLLQELITETKAMVQEKVSLLPSDGEAALPEGIEKIKEVLTNIDETTDSMFNLLECGLFQKFILLEKGKELRSEAALVSKPEVRVSIR